MRASLLALIVAAAGCYSPGIAPCQIACSANQECPDGLACNGQNACAMASDVLCPDQPMEDAGNGTNVTIEVRDRIGGPFAMALVVFADSGGAPIADVMTGIDGLASADVPAGGSATVIRMVPRAGAGMDMHASTYLDLWPGAHIISQDEVDKRARPVTFDLRPPPGSPSTATIYTSCSGYSTSLSTTVSVDVPLRCPTFDVLVIMGGFADPSNSLAAVAAAQTGPSVTIPMSSFKPMRDVQGGLKALPTNAASIFLYLSGWVTPTLSSPNRPFASLTVPVAGNIDAVVPENMGFQKQLFVTYEAATPGIISPQLVIERIPANPTMLDRDYNNTFLYWLGEATMDLGTLRMSWPFYTPVGPVLDAPTFFAASVTYDRDVNTSVTWRITGDASRITTMGTTQSITYPVVPGVRAFAPADTDTLVKKSVSLFGVEPLAARDVRQILEPEGFDLGYFKVPALRHMTISAAAE